MCMVQELKIPHHFYTYWQSVNELRLFVLKTYLTIISVTVHFPLIDVWQISLETSCMYIYMFTQPTTVFYIILHGIKLDTLLLHEKAISFDKNLQRELTKKFLFTVSQYTNNVSLYVSYLFYDGL